MSGHEWDGTELNSGEALLESLSAQLAEQCDEQNAVNAAIFAMRAAVGNSVQAILRESPGLIDTIFRLGNSLGVTLQRLPYNRWAIDDSRILPGAELAIALWSLLLEAIDLKLLAAQGARFREEAAAGILQHAAAHTCVPASSAPERWLDGHNLYPIPVHRPDWSIGEALEFYAGNRVSVDFFEFSTSSISAELVSPHESGLDPYILPVHPLAPMKSHGVRNILDQSKARLLKSSDAWLLTSIRTLRTAEGDFKLPIDTWITSASRLLKREYYPTSTLMAQIGRAILDREQPSTWGIQLDTYAAWISNATAPPLLGVIKRDPPLIDHGREVWCAVDFVADAQRLRRSVGAHGGLEGFLNRYVECVVFPSVILAARYGVFVEPHLQNVLLVIRSDGFLEQAYHRDLDNISLYPAWAMEHGLVTADFQKHGSLQETPLSLCLSSFRHALRDAHLSELVVRLASYSGTDAHQIAILLQNIAHSYSDAASTSRREQIIGGGILSPNGAVKRLLEMHITRSDEMLFDTGLGADLVTMLRDHDGRPRP